MCSLLKEEEKKNRDTKIRYRQKLRLEKENERTDKEMDVFYCSADTKLFVK